MRYSEIIVESKASTLYSNQPGKFLSDLLQNGSFTSKSGYTSLTTSKNLAATLDDLAVGMTSYGGDILMRFDAEKLSQTNQLTKVVYTVQWFKQHPELFTYVTHLKWANSPEEFYKINKKAMTAYKDYLEDVDSDLTVEETVAFILEGLEFEREVIVKTPFKYVDGLILSIEFANKAPDSLLALAKQHSIKVVGYNNILRDEKDAKERYKNGISIDDYKKLVDFDPNGSDSYEFFDIEQALKLEKLVGKFVKGNNGTSGVLDRVYFYPSRANTGRWYAAGVMKNKKGEITNYSAPLEFLNYG